MHPWNCKLSIRGKYFGEIWLSFMTLCMCDPGVVSGMLCVFDLLEDSVQMAATTSPTETHMHRSVYRRIRSFQAVSSTIKHSLLIVKYVFFFSHRKLKETSRGKRLFECTDHLPVTSFTLTHYQSLYLYVTAEWKQIQFVAYIKLSFPHKHMHMIQERWGERERERERERDMGVWTLGTETEGRKWNAENKQC